MKRVLLICIGLVFVGSIDVSAQRLRALDPTQGGSRQATIESALVSVQPDGAYMEVGLYLTLSPRGSGLQAGVPLELEFDFGLPEGSIVTDSWLWVADSIMQALLLDRWTASAVYEGIVNRRRDPSILTKTGTNNYELRIYPTDLTESRKVKLTYLVPMEIVGDTGSIPLPTDLLSASRYEVPTLEIIARTAGQFGSPDLFGDQAAATLDLTSDAQLGEHYRGSLDLSKIDRSSEIRLGLSQSFTDGIQLTTFEGEQDAYFHLILQPASFLPTEGATRLAVLVDHDAANSSISSQGIMESVKANLIANLGPQDFFNLFVTQVEVQQYSDTWVPATEAAIEAAFAAVGLPANYSSLPAGLSRALGFIGTNGGDGVLAVVSSSDQFATNERANALLTDLDPGSTQAQIQVVDYQDKSVDEYRIGGTWYRGNGYLYTNLSQLTGGVYYGLSGSSTLSQNLTRALSSGGALLSSVDLYTDLSGGFTYGRTTSANSTGLVSTQEAIVQMGRFVGIPPFNVTFSGVIRQNAFSKRVDVSDSSVLAGGKALEQAWAGQQISALERLTARPEVINQILDLSLKHRVLSMYSAFLALEPSDTTRACLNCVDEAATTAIEPDFDLPQADSLIQIYPNPFSGVAQIRVALPPEMSGTDVNLVVYDILGRAVRRIPVGYFTGQPRTVQWDGSGDHGRRLASGVYMVVLSTPRGTRSAKAILN